MVRVELLPLLRYHRPGDRNTTAAVWQPMLSSARGSLLFTVGLVAFCPQHEMEWLILIVMELFGAGFSHRRSALKFRDSLPELLIRYRSFPFWIICLRRR